MLGSRLLALIALFSACESIAPISHNSSECFSLENCAQGFVCIGASATEAGLCLRPDSPVCGDGLTRAGLVLGEAGFESCDDGNLSNIDGCNNDCRLARCGDGFIRNDLAPETDGFDSDFENCEDGNLVDDDGCTNRCQRARCGDGVLRRDLEFGEPEFEACDDGNLLGDDECTTLCTVARCGDGFVQAGLEGCDDANDEDQDECTTACELARCGDGIARRDIAEGALGFEACDDGDEDDLNGCSNACLGAACGDGTVQVGEYCDDGNRIDDDDCDNYCGVGVVQLVLEQKHGCALTANGDVFCWGANGDGELGLGDRRSRGRATQIPGLSGVVSLHSSRDGTCAVMANGTVNCWGLGQADIDLSPGVLTRVDEVLSFSMIDGGGCAAQMNGKVFCWNYAAFGALEDFARVLGIDDAIQVVGGLRAGCARSENGEVRCWGTSNDGGWLGDGTLEPHVDARPVLNLAPAEKIFGLGSGFCARLADASTWCWGAQSVVPTAQEGPHPLPVLIPALQNIKSMHWYQVNTRWALADDGSLWFWHGNDRDPVRDTRSDYLVYGAGHQLACWVNREQEVHCDGRNNLGQRGVGVPPYVIEPVTLDLGTESITSFRVNVGHGGLSCAVHGQGAVSCWGDHDRIDGGASRRPEGLKRYRLEIKAGLSSVTQLSVTDDMVCARNANGTVSCWGAGGNRRLGRGSDEANYDIGLVLGIDDAEQVEASSSHVCVRRSDGTVGCWGVNYFGQLGNGNNASSNVVVPVSGLENVIDLAVVNGTSCALRQDSRIWCWGSNGGQAMRLGQGVLVDDAFEPILVPNLSDVTSISIASQGFCAAHPLTKGTCWGTEYMPSSSNNRNVARIRDWLPADLLSFAGATNHGAALSSSGEVWLWGFSLAGNQGLINPDPSNNRRTWYDPHTVEGFELAVEVQAPKEFWGDGTCILTRTGRIQCVGRSSDPAYYHLQDATRVVGLNGYEAPPAP